MQLYVLGLAIILTLSFCVQCSAADTPAPSAINVVDFGAVADGKQDNTQAFQKALDTAAQGGKGGVVFVPVGHYFFSGHLTIPASVTLQGIWSAPSTANYYQKPGVDESLLTGSVLLPTEGEGAVDGTPFISLSANSVVKGLTFYYPNQIRTNPPKAYPWTISIAGGGADNCSVMDVLMINPYQAVDFGTKPSGRHFVRNLFAYPLYKGLFVDKCYDVGRIENVHFWPFWGYTGDNDALGRFVSDNATAFIFARTDWEYVSNCFSIFYHVGFQFTSFNDGPGNVLLSQSGADIAPIAVLVDNCQGHSGVLFSNSQNFGRIVVKKTNTGPVKFTGCGFFGASREVKFAEPGIADISGDGHVSFDNCSFITLDPLNTTQINIRASGGGLTISNSLFLDSNRTHIILEQGLRTGVITGNTFRGDKKIVDNSGDKAVMGLNIDDAGQKD